MNRKMKEVQVPASKSYMNRALVIAALREGESRLYNPTYCDDCEVMIRALEKLGVEFSREERVVVVRGGLRPFRGEIDIGPAGTAMRFLLPMCAFTPGCEVVLTGTERMRERPIGHLVSALRSLGAKIEYLGRQGCPPVRIYGIVPPAQGEVELDGGVSSQFVSALLLVTPLFRQGLSVTSRGQQVSGTYIAMTRQILAEFVGTEYVIEGDLSAAAYFWALASVCGEAVRVSGINPDSLQGEAQFPDLLEEMGCSVSRGKDFVMVQGPVVLSPISADMSQMPDSAQTLAVVAAFARGESRLTGLSTLRIKETDRLHALESELLKMGITSESGGDFIVIHGGTPHAAVIETYDDHRMAMAFSVAGGRLKNMVITHPEVVSKSFPGFFEEFLKIGIQIMKK